METKERILFWDILKGYGIISIVLGHSCPPAAPYVYTYHLALFFFVSAYFYNEKKYLNKPFEYVGNLFKNNWTKYVFYMTVLIGVHNLTVRLGIDYGAVYYESLGQMAASLTSSVVFICSEKFGGAMWFVLPNIIACAFIALLVCFCERVSSFVKNSKAKEIVKNLLLIMLVFVIMIAFSKTPQIFSIHNAFLMLPVSLGAYFLKKYVGVDVKKYLNTYLALFFTGLIFVFVKYTGFRVELAANINPGYVWLYVLSFIGIYVCMYLAKITEKIPYFKKMIAFLGRYSFAIMALHFIAIKMVDKIYCKIIGETTSEIIGKWVCSYPEKLWWVYLISGTVFPAIFGYIMNLIKKRSAQALEKNRV